jgi:hypothetical protein
MAVCLSVCKSVCLSVYPFDCLSARFSVCLSVCLFVYLSVCMSFRWSICLSVCFPLCMSVCLSLFLSVCLPGCLPVFCVPVCLALFLSVCVSVSQRSCLSVPVCLFVSLSVCIPPERPASWISPFLFINFYAFIFLSRCLSYTVCLSTHFFYIKSIQIIKMSTYTYSIHVSTCIRTGTGTVAILSVNIILKMNMYVPSFPACHAGPGPTYLSG